MSRPNHPHDLIYTPSTDVLYPDWVEQIGDRQVFRISGLRQYLVTDGNFNYGGGAGFATEERVENARATLHEIQWDQWCRIPRQRITKSGVIKYAKARQGRNRLLSLYGALLIILMLEDYVEGIDPTIDIYEGGSRNHVPTGVKIIPYIFDVIGARQADLNNVSAQLPQLRQEAGQANSYPFLHLCEPQCGPSGEIVSETTARVLNRVCNLKTGVEVALEGRKPCRYESPLYPLT